MDSLHKKHRELWDSPPHDGYDCGEIAEDFQVIGGGGQIARITPTKGATLRVPERGRVVEHQYHEVYVEGGLVYDPRYAPDPTPEGEYFDHIRALNNGGTNIDVIG